MKAKIGLPFLSVWGLVLLAGCSVHPFTDELSHHEMGMKYEEMGRFDLAAYHYRRAIEVDPDYAPLYASLGYVYLRLGKLDSARYAFSRAVRMDSNQYAARANLILLDFMNSERPRRPAVVSYFLDPYRFDAEMQKLAAGLGLSPALVLAIAKVESGFDPFAHNSVGAGGLMQLMPETARALGLRVPPTCRTGQPPDTLDPRVDERFHPLRSIEAGTRYLDQLIQKYRSGNRLDLYLPLAAYNTGPNAVAAGKIPPTGVGYAKKVVRTYLRRRDDSTWLRKAMRRIRDRWAKGLKALGIEVAESAESPGDSLSVDRLLDFAHSLQKLSDSVNDGQSAAQMLVDAAAILSFAHRYVEAASILCRAHSLQPDSLQWLAWSADILLAAGHIDSAESLADQVIEQDSTNVLAWIVVGDVKGLEGDFQAATAYLERAVQQDSCSRRAWNDLGVISLLRLRLDESEAQLESALACDSLSFLPWYNLALVKFLRLVLEKASEHLTNDLTFALCDSLNFYTIPEDKQIRPFDWPAKGSLTSLYGWRPDPFSGSVRKSEFHTGIDIDGATGDPVMAPANGVVEDVKKGYNGGYGNMIILTHDLGKGEFRTGFHHLSEIYVQVGDTVTRGQKIGTIGSTGRSTGSHLHFMIWKNGELVNPLLYLKPRSDKPFYP